MYVYEEKLLVQFLLKICKCIIIKTIKINGCHEEIYGEFFMHAVPCVRRENKLPVYKMLITPLFVEYGPFQAVFAHLVYPTSTQLALFR